MDAADHLPIIQGIVIEGLEASSVLLPPGTVMVREEYDAHLSLLHHVAYEDEMRDYNAIERLRAEDMAAYRASQHSANAFAAPGLVQGDLIQHYIKNILIPAIQINHGYSRYSLPVLTGTLLCVTYAMMISKTTKAMTLQLKPATSVKLPPNRRREKPR